jgi:hypothetical protein
MTIRNAEHSNPEQRNRVAAAVAPWDDGARLP